MPSPASRRARRQNAVARFLPGNGHEAWPAITVAGCMILARVRDGRVDVAIDLDDAAPSLRTGPGGTVPVRVTIQGTDVYRVP